MPEPASDDFQDEGSLVLEQRFAIVPERIIDADISDCAFRLYAVLLRYGQSSGQRMPGRALLARRLRKGSKDTVDRALKELVAIGAVVVQRRRTGRQNLTNRYHLMSTPPGIRQTGAHPPGRNFAATPRGRSHAATPGRNGAARVASSVRPNPVVPTETTPPPAPPRGPDCGRGPDRRAEATRQHELLIACGAEDLDALAGRCQQLRRSLGRPTTRWSRNRLVEVLHTAVVVKGWPAAAAVPALLALAADPATLGPMRLACPGPWWDSAPPAAARTNEESAELATLEARLAHADGRRVWAQQRARAELELQGVPLTRLAVARKACEVLTESVACSAEATDRVGTFGEGAGR